MTKEDIAKIAYSPTLTDKRIEIIFKDLTKIVGYFDENNKEYSDLYYQNIWSFVILKQQNNKQKNTLYNGDDFHEINIRTYP